MALISISSPSINPAPDQQISEDTEIAVDQSSSPPPRNVVRRSTGITIMYWWYAVCDCGMDYRIENIKSQIYRISSRETTVEVPYVKEHVHFDCPCGSRVELTTNVTEPVKKKKYKVVYSPRQGYEDTTSRILVSKDGGEEMALGFESTIIW